MGFRRAASFSFSFSRNLEKEDENDILSANLDRQFPPSKGLKFVAPEPSLT